MSTPFEDLFELVDKSDKIVVHDDEDSIVYSSTEKSDVESLGQALHQCLENPLFRSQGMGRGSPRITLYHDGEEVLQISHHSSCKSIHCSLYSFDIPLSKPQAWLEWFDQKKIPGPREEYEKLAAKKRQQKEAYKQFVKSMPPYLSKAWKKHETTIRFDGKCPDDLKRALRKNLCGKTVEEKIADVLTWYGSTAATGGKPIYERAVEGLLLDFAQDIENAIETQYAAEGRLSDPRLIMGSYKLAGSLRFKKKYPEGLHLEPMPQPLGVTF